jgi:hypothetical protein
MKYQWSKTRNGECDKLEDVPKGATIEYVDDKVCIGICEGCGKPITEDEKYAIDIDGCLICSKCMEELNSCEG